MAALLLAQILPVFSVVAPCLPGAALRDLCRDPRGQDTSRAALIARWNGVVAVPWTTSVRTGSLPRRAESSSYSATVYSRAANRGTSSIDSTAAPAAAIVRPRNLR